MDQVNHLHLQKPWLEALGCPQWVRTPAVHKALISDLQHLSEKPRHGCGACYPSTGEQRHVDTESLLASLPSLNGELPNQ